MNALVFSRDILDQCEVYYGILRYLIFYFLGAGTIALKFGTQGKIRHELNYLRIYRKFEPKLDKIVLNDTCASQCAGSKDEI